MVRSTLVSVDKASERRAVHNGSAALLAHLLQFKLHAAPYSVQVEGHNADAAPVTKATLFFKRDVHFYLRVLG
jgi:hypothetical protein